LYLLPSHFGKILSKRARENEFAQLTGAERSAEKALAMSFGQQRDVAADRE
jgi:hypothetical protein